MMKEWIAEYQPKNDDDVLFAMREIMQEIALAGLSRTDFFKKATIYGESALRIFYGLDRFSEDLSFSLLEADSKFSLEPYFVAILDEFASQGMSISIREEDEKVKTAIESAFLKSDTIWKELILEDIVKQTGIKSSTAVKIKIEVDRKPPLGFKTEEKLMLRPYSFYVKVFTKPNLFAGKINALLFRKWKIRTKGRDWYDMEWCIRKGIPLNLNHFMKRATDTGDWFGDSITQGQVIQLLTYKINSVNIEQIKEDVIPFILNPKVLDIWSKEYFLDLIGKLKFE